MGLREDLLDPWGGIVAGVAGGMAWAVTASATGAAVPIGLGVAAAVYGTKVAVGALTGQRGRPVRAEPELPSPERGSAADLWQTRALRAIDDLHELTRSQPDGPAALLAVDERTAGTRQLVRRLAGQAAAVGQALRRIPAPALADERDRLRAQLARVDRAGSGVPPDEVSVQRRSSLRSVEEQLAVAERLAMAQDTLIARLQSTALGLEGLIARTAEVLAMSVSMSAGAADDQIVELAGELDGLRAGMAETERLSRQVLGRQ
ncbi:MAG: hypothetical protein HY241_11485 [Actinobacteria bacterium]|nr:hypothetical protein [Actinomycetota bacterium]